MSGRDLISKWIRFFVGIVTASVAVAVGAGGLEGLFIGIFLVSLAAAVVVIPLLVLSSLWIITSVIGLVTRARYEAATGETITNEDWRQPKD